MTKVARGLLNHLLTKVLVFTRYLRTQDALQREGNEKNDNHVKEKPDFLDYSFYPLSFPNYSPFYQTRSQHKGRPD